MSVITKSKFLSIVSALFIFTACSSTKSGLSSLDATSEAATKYATESENLEPFSVIPGSATDAKASDRVFFDYDSSALSRKAQDTLQKQAEWLKDNAAVKVSVEGHCDERGTREYNLALGARRAAAVKSYLVSNGVVANRITTVSYGKERPVVGESNAAAWAENRRSVTVIKVK